MPNEHVHVFQVVKQQQCKFHRGPLCSFAVTPRLSRSAGIRIQQGNLANACVKVQARLKLLLCLWPATLQHAARSSSGGRGGVYRCAYECTALRTNVLWPIALWPEKTLLLVHPLHRLPGVLRQRSSRTIVRQLSDLTGLLALLECSVLAYW